MTALPRLQTATVGVVEHGNTAVLITLGPGGALLDRRTVALTRGLPTHPYHHEGAWAVGRYLQSAWARPMALVDAIALIEQVHAAAARGAAEALADVARVVALPIQRIAIRACPALPATIEARIRDNRAQTMADAVMYRQAIADAAVARGWTVHWYTPDQVVRDAAKALSGVDVEDFLRAMGQLAGPPWQAKHKLAAMAAVGAMGVVSA